MFLLHSDGGTGTPTQEVAPIGSDEKDEKDDEPELDDSAKFKTGEKVNTHPPGKVFWDYRMMELIWAQFQ